MKAHIILGAGLRVSLNLKNLVQWDHTVSSNPVNDLYTRVGSEHSLI